MEVLASLTLLTVLLGISLTSAGKARKSNPEALAFILAEHFRAAQATALAKGYPVGIGFPSNGGSLATCQGFYQLEGHVFPRVTMVKQYGTEIPGTVFGLVHWSNNGSPDAQDKAEESGFLLETWGLDTVDPVLIFLPDGTITSNGIAHGDGVYNVVVSEGFRASSTGSSSADSKGTSYRLTAARRPHTVSLSLEGSVSVASGLPGGESLTTDQPISVQTVAPPLPSAPSNAPPEILSHVPYPKPVEEVATDAVVPVGGSLTLEVEAWSPSGSALFALWEGPGGFSAVAPLPLKWDPIAGNWKGRVDWHPPEDAIIGDVLKIDVKVNDEFGNVNATVSVDPIDVEVVPRTGLISYRTGTDVRQIFENGSGDEQVASGGYRYPAWSPDGSKLLVCDGSSLKLAVPDVGVVRTVISHTGPIYRPKWSPDGTEALYTADGGLWIVSLDGSSQREISNLPADRRLSGGYGWHPNGDKVIFCVLKTNSVWTGEIWVAKADGTHREKVSGNYLALYASYSPLLPSGEVKVAFYGYGGECHGIFITDDEFSSTPERVHPSFWTSVNSLWQVGWSNDGKWVSFYGGPLSQTWSLKSANVDTKARVSYAGSSVDHTWGVWSPFSPKVIFREGSGLTIVNAEGNGRKRITSGNSYEPDWVR